MSNIEEIELNFKKINLSEHLFAINLFKTKRFKFFLIFLSLITLVNAILIYWIFKSIQLRNDGIFFQNFHLISKNVNVKNYASFKNGLTSKSIISLNSDEPFNIINENDQLAFIIPLHLFINVSLKAKNQKIEFIGPKFSVYSNFKSKLEPEFNIQSDEVSFTTVEEIINSNYGNFKILNSLETNTIKGSSFQDLRVESKTKTVNVTAKDDVNIISKGNGLEVVSFHDITFQAEKRINFKSTEVEFQSLPKKKLHRHELQNSNRKSNLNQTTFQVCSCEDGTIFLVPTNHHCSASFDICTNQDFSYNK